MILTLVALFAFSCAELRYAPRTDMVEVASDAVVVAQPTSSRPPSKPQARSTAGRWQALVIGGTIASLAGIALIVGGAVGWQKQAAANAAADAECLAEGGWFCGLFEDLSYIRYGMLIGFGSIAAAAGVVLIGVGASRLDRQRDRP
jgi:hypothetical protein